jgi:hypothetical protein
MPTTSEANPAFMSALRAALQDLTRRHEVHIATRPQDTSIEAGWRQWGFRYSTFLRPISPVGSPSRGSTCVQSLGHRTDAD